MQREVGSASLSLHSVLAVSPCCSEHQEKRGGDSLGTGEKEAKS